jgi:hypothetical protein
MLFSIASFRETMWSKLMAVVLALNIVVLNARPALAAPPTDPVIKFWDKQVPPEVKFLVDTVHTVVGSFVGVVAAIDVSNTAAVLVTVLKLFGLGGSSNSELLKVLSERIDKLGTQLSWLISMSFRDNRLADAITAAQKVEEMAASKMLPLALGSDTDLLSHNAVNQARQESAFLRTCDERATDGESGWKKIIKDRPQARTGGLCYDWRLGIPALLQVMALRLPVLMAMNPQFRVTGWFQVELTAYRKALLDHHQTMVDGVRCDYRFQDRWDVLNTASWGADLHYYYLYTDVTISCADIFTGLAATGSFQFEDEALAQSRLREEKFFSSYYWFWRPLSNKDAVNRQTILDTKVTPLMEQLRRGVLQRMPLFQMRSMIDMLFLLTHPQIPDLTEAEQNIRVVAAPHLCLDLQWGSRESSTPVWLWECNGTNAQWWVYDRETGTIRNPASDRCLDVQWGNPEPQAPAWLWDCNGTDAQRWTYDPETGVLQSAIGTVLDVEWGVLQARTPIHMWPRNNDIAQQWFSAP